MYISVGLTCGDDHVRVDGKCFRRRFTQKYFRSNTYYCHPDGTESIARPLNALQVNAHYELQSIDKSLPRSQLQNQKPPRSIEVTSRRRNSYIDGLQINIKTNLKDTEAHKHKISTPDIQFNMQDMQELHPVAKIFHLGLAKSMSTSRNAT